MFNTQNYNTVNQQKPAGKEGRYAREKYQSECMELLNAPKVYTGYENIDKITSLYPGLYVIGGVSSIGKTTFMLQMCDQMAAAKHNVMYFSFEQSENQLVSKSLARITSDISGKYDGYSSLEIKEHLDDRCVKAALEEYADIGNYIDIRNPQSSMTVKSIERAVTEYIEQSGVVPVVIVDYLQTIHPMTSFVSDVRHAIDNDMTVFSDLQMKYNMVIFVLSSLNRASYMLPVTTDSFKESGGIEYYSDVVFGMQYDVFNNEVFLDSNTPRAHFVEKQNILNNAKKANPRKIELVCLKSRTGRSDYTCKFDYYPTIDKFVPILDGSTDNGEYYAGNNDIDIDNLLNVMLGNDFSPDSIFH